MGMSKSSFELDCLLFDDDTINGLLNSHSCPKKVLSEEYYKSHDAYKEIVERYFSNVSNKKYLEYIEDQQRRWDGISPVHKDASYKDKLVLKNKVLQKLKKDFYNKPSFTNHPLSEGWDMDYLEKTFKRFHACYSNKRLAIKELKHGEKSGMIPVDDIISDISERSNNSKQRYKTLIRKNFIEQVFKDFCNLFSEDPILMKKIKESVYLTGGSLYSKMNKQPIKDYDFFAKDSSVVKEIFEYLFKFNPKNHVWDKSIDSNGRLRFDEIEKNKITSIKLKDQSNTIIDKFYFKKEVSTYTSGLGIMVIEKTSKIDCVITPNAISFSLSVKHSEVDIPETVVNVQLITKYIGDHKKIINNFDFEHCKMVVNFHKKKVYSSFLTDLAIKKKTLIPSKNKNIELSIFRRVSKFIGQGMSFPLHAQIDIFRKIQKNKLDKQYVCDNVEFYDKEDELIRDDLANASSLEEFERVNRKKTISKQIKIKDKYEIIESAKHEKSYIIIDSLVNIPF